ncbi:MAG: dihydrolipoyl dehydrogenase [Synergistaceae bacterium]|jgi:dihydrolipoamide dehydrogenase|nr:dihydrolipoyl dehydrogenase [Synergistaceae bacterium]
MSDYELVVVGAGPGGYVAAIRAAQLGMRTAIVERSEVGGTCLNRGCVPTKSLMHAAHLMGEIKNARRMGITLGSIDLNIEQVYERKNEVVNQLRTGVEDLLAGNGVRLMRGRAVIESAGEIKQVRVGDFVVSADKILIATGGMPTRLSIPGADLPGVLTSDDILGKSGTLYKHLTIIGGGVIGVEFAGIFNAFGADVTIIEAMDRLIPTMDREISQNLQMILKRRAVHIHTAAGVKSIESVEGGLKCLFEKKDTAESVTGDAVLISVGRRANTDGLLSERIEISMDRGMIPVDENFETEIEGIYAVGDVVKGGVQLAHFASSQGVCAVAAMLSESAPIDLSVVPSCIYTDPEIASVGITADEAKRRGIPCRTGKFVMSANGKNVIEMAERGFVKVVFHEESDVLLGAQMMCPRATDMIGEFASGIANHLTVRDMSKVMRAHPTFSEAMGEAIEDVDARAIHIMPRKR